MYSNAIPTSNYHKSVIIRKRMAVGWIGSLRRVLKKYETVLQEVLRSTRDPQCTHLR